MVNRSDKLNSFSAQKAPRKGLRSLLLKYSDVWIEQTLYFLPNYSGRCIQGATYGIGTTVSAGLPNITGTVATNSQYFSSNDSKSSGALRQAAFYGARNQHRADDSSANYISFDASLSNGIYGSSTTVQPAALKVAVLVKHD